MRIVHFFRSPVGGIFRHVRDLLGQQAADGHEVGIICDSLTGGSYEDGLFREIEGDLALGLHRIAIPRSISPRDAATLMRAIALMRKIRPDIVHTHSAKGGIHGRLAAAICRSSAWPIKTFYCPHGGAMHYDPKSLKGKVFFSAERFMERFTDSLIFVSEYEKLAYHEKVGVPACKDAVVYNGLSEAEFKPVTMNPKPADFLYIGMMRDLKGPDVFLDALAAARKETGEDLTAMFVGDGPDKPSYLERIDKLGLKSCVSVYEAMPARQAFAQARIVVVPSRAESMPYLVLEAAAAHKPMIATRVGGIPEIFQDHQGRLIEPGNARALSRAMLAMFGNTLAEDEAAAFAESLRKRFSLAAMASAMEAIYRG